MKRGDCYEREKLWSICLFTYLLSKIIKSNRRSVEFKCKLNDQRLESPRLVMRSRLFAWHRRGKGGEIRK